MRSGGRAWFPSDPRVGQYARREELKWFQAEVGVEGRGRASDYLLTGRPNG